MPSPAPDVDNGTTAPIAQEIVHQRRRVARAGPVVLLRIRPEGLGAVTILVEHPLIVAAREGVGVKERHAHPRMAGADAPPRLFP